MIIKAVEWDNNNQPTKYMSSAVYTIKDGQRVLASNGIVAPTLEEVVALIQHAECSFDHIWIQP